MAGEGEAASVRAVGAAKAEAYRQGIEAVGAGGYTAMQLAAILGENKVKLVPDIAVSGDGRAGWSTPWSRACSRAVRQASRSSNAAESTRRGAGLNASLTVTPQWAGTEVPSRFRTGWPLAGMDPRSLRDLPGLARPDPGTLFSYPAAMLFLRNLRLGLRLLRRNPSFALSAVAVMALGIGASTAVFSVVKGVLLTPLPYREPSRSAVPGRRAGIRSSGRLNREEFHAVGTAGSVRSVGVINESREPHRAGSHGGRHRGVGQRRLPGDARRDAGPRPRRLAQGSRPRYVNAVTISYGLWSGAFRATQIVGREIEVNNLPMRVAGVLPRRSTCISVPASSRRGSTSGTRAGFSYNDEDFAVGSSSRAAEGVTLDAARAALRVLATGLVAQHPSSYPAAPLRCRCRPWIRRSSPRWGARRCGERGGGIRPARSLREPGEPAARPGLGAKPALAVRVSIGASRGHIIGQLTAEGLVLGVLGAGGGTAHRALARRRAAAPGSRDASETGGDRRRCRGGALCRRRGPGLRRRREPRPGLAGNQDGHGYGAQAGSRLIARRGRPARTACGRPAGLVARAPDRRRPDGACVHQPARRSARLRSGPRADDERVAARAAIRPAGRWRMPARPAASSTSSSPPRFARFPVSSTSASAFPCRSRASPWSNGSRASRGESNGRRKR